jgi:hypothetical protein
MEGMSEISAPAEKSFRRPIARWERWCLRADPWLLLLLALPIPVWYFWIYRSPTVAMVGHVYYEDFCVGALLFGSIAAGRGFQLLLRGMCESRYRIRSSEFRSKRWFLPWFLLIGLGTYPMLEFNLPMQVSFRVSRPALDRIADEALADPANAHPLTGRWAGLYRIAGVEVIGKTVVLYLGRDKGSYGFARIPEAKNDAIFSRSGYGTAEERVDLPTGEHQDMSAGERMADDWFVVFSWYHLVKVGWS